MFILDVPLSRNVVMQDLTPFLVTPFLALNEFKNLSVRIGSLA